MKDKYFMYILHSQSYDRYYVGMTSDLEERLILHNGNHIGYTGKYSDWRIVYSEEFAIKSEAYARERAVKKWKSRKMIERLIVGT
jgi:putative endonuclease